MTVRVAPTGAAAMSVPGVRVHLYEKKEARAGRKMGHLVAFGTTTALAAERAVAARTALTVR